MTPIATAPNEVVAAAERGDEQVVREWLSNTGGYRGACVLKLLLAAAAEGQEPLADLTGTGGWSAGCCSMAHFQITGTMMAIPRSLPPPRRATRRSSMHCCGAGRTLASSAAAVRSRCSAP